MAGTGVELLKMADSRVQRQIVESWAIDKWLPNQFNRTKFCEKSLPLIWGGQFKFDAVSADNKTIGLISTSAAFTASRKKGYAKFHKIKADALYLLNVVGAKKLFMVFTEDSMFSHFEKEKKSKRFPPEIEFLYVKLPPEIQRMVEKARSVASAETSPNKRGN